jgi:hypothetical protein
MPAAASCPWTTGQHLPFCLGAKYWQEVAKGGA